MILDIFALYEFEMYNDWTDLYQPEPSASWHLLVSSCLQRGFKFCVEAC